jgi:Glycosyl hydrolase family 63 C-terminal domain
MAVILCEYDPMYEEIAFKFLQHFMWIAYAMDRLGENHDEMWEEQDGFFYDLLRFPDGQAMRLKVRSLVGLLPLCASTVFEASDATRFPKLAEMIALFRKRHPELISHVAPTDAGFIGYKERRLLSILNKKKLERVLAYMLDENEFFGPYGIRSLSRYHLEHPFVFWVGDQEYKVQYLPGESNNGMFGGNSNWRGPVWMPVNGLIVRALTNLYAFYGDEFKVQCPTGSGHYMTLFEVAQELVGRLTGIFLRDAKGQRPAYGGTAKFQDDPHWRDLILFHEYFHGDNGAGLGASHQTGWTGLVAPLLDLFGRVDAKTLLETERGRVFARVVSEQVGGEGK